MRSNIDKEKTKKTLAQALENIGTEADPWLLAEYLSLYKKEVPLFHRSKVAAYLLMLFEQGKGIRLDSRPARRDDSARRGDPARPEKNASRRGGGEKRPAQQTAPSARDDGRGDAQRYPLADEESRRLFFSVGRSRRVFPREILGLINSKTAIPKDDIGAIRILDNYSFVQVRDTVAEQIIEALNGISFRGRPLTVNYAKSRRDEENSAAESENESEAYADEEESPVEYAESESYDQDRSAEADDAQEYDAPDESYATADQDAGSEQGQDHPEEKDI